jgi:WD40 repeat protein/energy-coupling factor transporter ATP-binding protein EcfA2
VKEQGVSDKKFSGPFPGLRPFYSSEAAIFFGCATQVDDMIRRLEDHRFLTVVGPSGCGKSSLVRAGLLPALKSGELFSAGDQWQMVTMRPSDSPFSNLAIALQESLRKLENGSRIGDTSGDRIPQPDRRETQDPQILTFTEAVLQSGPLGFVEAIEDARVPAERNVLLLVDQFEEIFRFRYPDQSYAENDDENRQRIRKQRSDANAFVNLLLTTSKQTQSQVYVVLTMRSDFIGDCNSFHGLPEAINDSQFLTPRLNQNQIRDAIVGPLRLFGADAQPAFINRILADIGNDADQLPLMQHALMRMWAKSTAVSETGGDGKQPDSTANNLPESSPAVTFTLKDYRDIGGFKKALSIHADEAYNELTTRDQQVAQTLFRVLTERGPDRSDLRRPTRFADLVDIVSAGNATEAARTQVKRIIEVFRRSDRSFITPPEGKPIEDPVVLDISHECLIRQWRRLNYWVMEEARAAETYRELLPPSRRWQERKEGLWKALGSLWRGQDLKRVLAWKKQANPAWAKLYGGNFDEAEKFIRASRIFAVIRWTVYSVLIILALGGLFFYQKNAATLEMLAVAKKHRAEAEMLKDQSLRSESLLWASISLRETQKGYSTTGMILALDAMHSDKLQRPEPKSERALYAALHVPHEIRILKGHSKVVAFGTFSPDGRWAVTASWDLTARVWNVDSGESVHVLEGHKESVVYAAFSPNSRHVITTSLDGSARIWDTETGQLKSILNGHKKSVQHAAFSPDGSRVVTASADETARIWLVETAEEINILKGHEDTVQLAVFNPLGTHVLTASWDKTARIWEADSGKQIHVLRGHGDTIPSAAFSPNGDYVVTASYDKTARLWNVNTGLVKHVLEGHTGEIWHVTFGQKGDQLATASRDNTARLWDVETGALKYELEGHQGAVRHVAFSPQDDRVVTASEDKSACLWDTETGDMITCLHRHEDKVRYAFFRPQGDRVITVSHDKTARIWRTPHNVLSGHDDAIVHASFSLQGDRIVTASNDTTARIWDVSGRNELFNLKGHQGSVLHAEFSPRGKHVVTASEDTTVRLWNAESGRPTHILKGHERPVLHATYSPQGNRIVTASADNTARIWDTQSGAEIHVLKGHTNEVVQAAFSKKGNRVVTASMDSTARIWDTESGSEIHVLGEHEAAVLHAAFSPAGKVVVTTSKDKTARMWNQESGAVIRVLRGHDAAVNYAAFNQPDGNLLVTVSNDHTALIWNLTKKKTRTASQTKPAGSATDLIGIPEDLDLTYRLPIVLRHEGPIQQAIFSPNGSRIMTASEDGTAVLWDVETVNRVAVLSGHDDTVHLAAFSPNDNLVLTASGDGKLRLWEVFATPKDLVDYARTIVKDRGLRLDEEKRIFSY